jgi:hypothetical protein
MKRLRDEQGTEWTVYQVQRQARSDSVTAGDFLPRTFANGWLVFECCNEKRRLAPFPSKWEELPETTLRSLLGVAVRARPSGEVAGKTFEDALRAEERRPVEEE